MLWVILAISIVTLCLVAANNVSQKEETQGSVFDDDWPYSSNERLKPGYYDSLADGCHHTDGMGVCDQCLPNYRAKRGDSAKRQKRGSNGRFSA